MRIDPAQEIELSTDRLVLKVLNPVFISMITEYYRRNKKFFEKYLPFYDNNVLTDEYQTIRIWTEFDLMVDDSAIRFYLFNKDDFHYKNIIGDISVYNIIRGAAESCCIGFKIDEMNSGKGYMAEALKKVSDYVFNELELSRIEVNVMKTNLASINLIEKIGFRQEGIAFSYLEIGGKREDHFRYSLIKNK
ncbi:MAG: GNAT family N-acetyltransferase [Ignavibacteriae bacterium]|nr:GNAT family N-acetyltransferase [Ignavibacteriota bacterium]